jgi:hypothetical protein
MLIVPQHPWCYMEPMQGQRTLGNLAVSRNYEPVDGGIVSTSAREGHQEVSGA